MVYGTSCLLSLVNHTCFVIIFITAVDCGSNLPNPANGDVHVVTTTLGSLAKYNCTDQFILVGHDTRICQADGTWSGQIPSCVTGIINFKCHLFL